MIPPPPPPPESTRALPPGELANTLTHLMGAVLSAAALALLVSLAAVRGDAWRIVTYSIYGATLVTLYLFSTLYHGVRCPRMKARMRVLDHASIYLLIAGTYTPFTLVHMRQTWVGWTLFGVIWGLCIAGILFKIYSTGRWRRISAVIYIAMGWTVVIAIRPAFDLIPADALVWLVAGGLIYTSGVIFFAWERLPHNHAIWHLFVLGGSACHFVAVWLCV